MNQIRLWVVSLGWINESFKMKKQVTMLCQHLLKQANQNISQSEQNKESWRKHEAKVYISW